jgi:hypothetical protein
VGDPRERWRSGVPELRGRRPRATERNCPATAASNSTDRDIGACLAEKGESISLECVSLTERDGEQAGRARRNRRYETELRMWVLWRRFGSISNPGLSLSAHRSCTKAACLRSGFTRSTLEFTRVGHRA